MTNPPLRTSPTLTWEDIQALLERLHSELEADGSNPEVTIAIGREGSLIGALYGINWRLKPFLSLERDFSFEDTTQKVSFHEIIPQSYIVGKRVLVIDCEVNTGTTMREVREYLMARMNASSVTTLALARSTSASFTPDYTGFTFEGERSYFPWEFTDELKYIRHTRKLSERN